MRRVARARRLLVATHNIMDGLHLEKLLPAYRALHRAEQIGVLCVQEDSVRSSARIAAALGGGFRVARHGGAPRLGVVYDGTRLAPPLLRVVQLPRLTQVPAWQRALYVPTLPPPPTALIARFARFTLLNFHVDAGGDEPHRASQLRALASAVPTSAAPVVACGDTNAFTWDAAAAEPSLARMLAPLRQRHGAHDAHAAAPTPTHFFARADEPKLGHQLAVMVGRLGLDLPRRYDVVCAAPRAVEARGRVRTPGSDHDCVWARLRI